MLDLICQIAKVFAIEQTIKHQATPSHTGSNFGFISSFTHNCRLGGVRRQDDFALTHRVRWITPSRAKCKPARPTTAGRVQL